MVTGRIRRADRWDGGDWDGGGWSADTPDASHAWIVDSFLVDDGRVQALETHQDRFTRACRSEGLDIPGERMTLFWEAVKRALPRSGQWFPRVEAHRSEPPSLILWIRPVPVLMQTLRVWNPGSPDPRIRPRVKGPDLSSLAALRDQAIHAGADDALLLDAAGVVLETAHSALLWWRGDTLCHPDPALAVLPSTTAARLRATAQRQGHPIRFEQPRLPDLMRLEVWAVNALHGIRPVTAWLDRHGGVIPAVRAETSRLARFRTHAARDAASLPS